MGLRESAVGGFRCSRGAWTAPVSSLSGHLRSDHKGANLFWIVLSCSQAPSSATGLRLLTESAADLAGSLGQLVRHRRRRRSPPVGRCGSGGGPDLALTGDGTALIAGAGYLAESDADYLPTVARVDSNGTVGPVSDDGYLLGGAASGTLYDVEVDASGRIWIAGVGTLIDPPLTGGFVVRLLPDGTRDEAWGAGWVRRADLRGRSGRQRWYSIPMEVRLSLPT